MNVLQSHRQPSNADDTASIAQPSVSPPPQRQTTDRNYLLDSRDVAALADPHSPLSDAVLDFALNRYLERLEHTRPDLVDQVHLFGTHFATFLSAVAERNGDWEGVLCGTRSKAGKPGVDLFAKRFLVVPTFLPGSEEVGRWALSIVVDAGAMVQDPPSGAERSTMHKCHILTFDCNGQVPVEFVGDLLAYLQREAADKVGKTVSLDLVEYASVPVYQPVGGSDCAVHVVQYLQNFLEGHTPSRRLYDDPVSMDLPGPDWVLWLMFELDASSLQPIFEDQACIKGGRAALKEDAERLIRARSPPMSDAGAQANGCSDPV